MNTNKYTRADIAKTITDAGIERVNAAGQWQTEKLPLKRHTKKGDVTDGSAGRRNKHE